MKNLILRAAAGLAVIAALFCVTCDENGLYKSSSNDGRANEFIRQFNGDVKENPSGTYTVTVESEGAGAGGTGSYSAGVTVVITAGAPPQGMRFSHWESTPSVTFDDAGSPTTMFPMPAGKVTVRAVFEPKPKFRVEYDLNGGNGTAPVDTREYNGGEEVVVKAPVNISLEGYQFTGWNTAGDGSGDNYVGGASLYIYDDTRLYAQWGSSSIQRYDVIVTGGTGSLKYAAGETVTITAMTHPDSEFVNWTVTSGGVTLANDNAQQTTFNMPNNNVAVKANFNAIAKYKVTIVNGGIGYSTSCDGDMCKQDEYVTINAGTPPKEQRFERWESDEVDVSGLGIVGSFIMPAKEVTVTANFTSTSQTVTTYKVTVISEGSGWKGDGNNYQAGDKVTIYAGADPAGKEFQKWMSSDGSVKFDNYVSRTTVFNMPAKDVTVTAVFTSKEPPVTTSEITIGNQIWSAQNINIETADSWCYDNNQDYCNKYGRLYTWKAAMEVCPRYGDGGWRLPSGADWDTLVAHTGGPDKAGMYLKAKTDWGEDGKWGGEDSYRFSALPGGEYSIFDGKWYFSQFPHFGKWWTADDFNDTYGNIRIMRGGSYMGEEWNNKVEPFSQDKGFGFSVRCIKR